MEIPKLHIRNVSLKQRINFQKSQALILAVALGVIGVLLLVLSFALTPGNGDFEAETMTVAADTPPVSGLLWTSNYDTITDPLSIIPAWAHEQEPHNPGLTGPVATDRMRVIPASESPGTGTYKPAGKVMRVELRPYNATPGGADGDANASGDTNRAEVYDRYPTTPASSTSADKWPDPSGSTRWYSFSVFIPADFPMNTDNWFVLTQWKGYRGGSPPEAIEIDNGSFELGSTHGRHDLGSINRGQWTHFEIGITLSTDPTVGSIQIFRNGTEVMPKTTRQTQDIVSGAVDPTYLKQGIYRTKAWAVTHVLYFGPMKVGTTQQSVQ